MKRKQVTALILSGMLTLGSVSPVMAAEGVSPKSSSDTETAAGDENAETDTPSVTGGMTAQAPATQQKTAEPTPASGTETTPTVDNSELPQAAAGALAGDNAATAPAADEPQADIKVLSLVDDTALHRMSDSLTAMINQSLEFYNSMNADEKAAISELYFGYDDVPAKLDKLKKNVTLEALKKEIAIPGLDEYNANIILTELEERIITEIDVINGVMRSAKNYVSDRIEYQQEGLARAIKLLQNILVKDRQLYTDNFIAQAQKYYDEAVTLKPGVQSYDYIVNFCNEVSMLISKSGEHLNFALLDEAIRAADAFAAFLACAPDPAAIANTEFKDVDGRVMTTIGDIADYVKSKAQEMEQAGNKISYEKLSEFSSLYYGNLLEAYNVVSNAILSHIAEQVEDAKYIGYPGDKKSAYDDVLKNYNAAMAAKNYEALPGLVSSLESAAKAYAEAAEVYAKTEVTKQIPELKDKLTAIQGDIQAYSKYYNDTYPTEVAKAIAALDSADTAAMSGRRIMDLINGAKAVIAKQSESYSQELKDTVSDAQSLTARANEWWAFLPEQMKAEAPYADAIALTSALTNAISGNGVYDLDALVNAYDAFVRDFNTAGGKIQTAAKAAAQYVLKHAEEVYGKESDNKHTDGVLKAFRDAIDNLKSSIDAWDFDGTRAAAAAVKNEEFKLLNDKPNQEIEKTQEIEKAQETEKAKEGTQTVKKSVKTGDMSNPAGAGLLVLASMTTAAGILSKRRR